MNLSEDQSYALQQLLDFCSDASEDNEFILTGGPGTGKTTILGELAKEIDLSFSATTNKAAGVLSNVLEESVSTIYSLLGLRVFTDYSNNTSSIKGKMKVPKHRIVVIDEASMIDKDLYFNYLRVLLIHAKIIYVGDKYQLPPVNSRFSIFDRNIKEAELTTVHRQDYEDVIDTLNDIKHAVVKSKNIIIKPSQHIHIIGDDKEFMDIVASEYLTHSEGDEVKSMAFSNKSVHGFNNYIRGIYQTKHLIEGNSLGDFPAKDEWVLFNNPYLINGDVVIRNETMAKIENIQNTDKSGELVLTITDQWGNYNQVIYMAPERANRIKKEAYADYKNNVIPYSELVSIQERYADVRPVYSCTVHKSQGSTYKTAFIDMNDINRCRSIATRNRLIYVAMSRARGDIYIYQN